MSAFAVLALLFGTIALIVFSLGLWFVVHLEEGAFGGRDDPW